MSDEKKSAVIEYLSTIHPEVDWAQRPGETLEQAAGRRRRELIKATRVPLHRRALSTLGEITTFVVYATAFGTACAIVRALWLLAGKV